MDHARVFFRESADRWFGPPVRLQISDDRTAAPCHRVGRALGMGSARDSRNEAA